MPAQAPQIIARKANGAAGSGQQAAGEPAKEKSGKRSGHGRSRRGRGRGDKRGEKKKDEAAKPRAPKPKPVLDGCKVVVRRIPPSMTEAEFNTILGEPWQVGQGKVDWFSYAKGKIPSDTAKNARPGRAYIHLIKKEDAIILDEAVRAATWEDAKGSFTNSCLVGPPILEHSIYKKVPLNKKRGDSRQGTIDQDPEFMAFLEELANPPGPNANGEADDADVNQKVTTTPLVEFLKEKKAAKSKEAANKKREAKNKTAAAKDDESSKKRSKDGKEAKGDKADKATKEPVKILSKKAANAAASSSVDNGKKATAKNVPEATTTSTTEDAPKSRRAGIAAAAKILQREQGLSPGTAHRKARQEASKPEATAAKSSGGGKEKAGADGTAGTEAEATDANKSRPSTPTGKQQNTRKRGGKGAEKKAAAETPAPVPTILKPPTILKKKPEEAKPATDAAAPATPSATPAPTNVKPAAQANAKSGAKSGSGKKQTTIIQDGTRGFVRHVNSSQGITDATLREALSAFGTVTAVDVDKRKAFAYVDFSDADALTKAIAASPITVAQGSVSVMERKEKKPTPAPASSGAAAGDKKDDKDKEKEKPAGRGRRGRGGGGGGGKASAAASAAPAPASDGNAAAPAPTPAPADGSG
ncbi:hypothetical protein VHEMI07282 [[Torrubiella] hemipterigena]|uniref:RRM domain-containing protein n=1 Tax=[Torrubiella] hemipterigena TaxID=1531966 RepID=A0A0A1TL31_9HYPO|nr:hypothetical protein VHEMI07282 [[Torrubiella] hemipterigena]